MNKLILTLLISLLSYSSISYSKWNDIEHPYDGLIIQVGDKKTVLNNTVIFWTTFKSTDNMNYITSQIIVDCHSYEYIQLFLEENSIVKQSFNKQIMRTKEEDMLFSPINYVCKDISLMCKVEENLDRTLSEESWDILKMELLKEGDIY